MKSLFTALSHAGTRVSSYNNNGRFPDFYPASFLPRKAFIHLIELVEMSKKLQKTYPRKCLWNFLEILNKSKFNSFFFGFQ